MNVKIARIDSKELALETHEIKTDKVLNKYSNNESSSNKVTLPNSLNELTNSILVIFSFSAS